MNGASRGQALRGGAQPSSCIPPEADTQLLKWALASHSRALSWVSCGTVTALVNICIGKPCWRKSLATGTGPKAMSRQSFLGPQQLKTGGQLPSSQRSPGRHRSLERTELFVRRAGAPPLRKDPQGLAPHQRRQTAPRRKFTTQRRWADKAQPGDGQALEPKTLTEVIKRRKVTFPLSSPREQRLPRDAQALASLQKCGHFTTTGKQSASASPSSLPGSQCVSVSSLPEKQERYFRVQSRGVLTPQ